MQQPQVLKVSNQETGVDMQVLDRLIAVAYWTDGASRARGMEVSDLTLAAFPSLLDCEGFLASKAYQGTEIFKYLSDVCDYEGALVLARRLVELEPPDFGEDGFTWMGAILHMYANRVEELTKLYKTEWLASPDREFAIELHEITGRLRPYRERTYEHPLASGPVKAELYKIDLEFFDKLVGPGDLPSLVLKDVFSATRQGQALRQVEILKTLLSMNERKLLNDQDLTLAAPDFWGKLKPNLELVPSESRSEVLMLLHRLGREAFSIDRMKSAKANFLSKKFGSMVLNQPWLALQVKNSGVPVSGKEIRESMKALEKASSLFERQWEVMITSDQSTELKQTLDALMDETSADDFAKRKMPEAYVSVLSTLMPYKGWVQKVSNQGRDNIFMADLGL